MKHTQEWANILYIGTYYGQPKNKRGMVQKPCLGPLGRMEKISKCEILGMKIRSLKFLKKTSSFAKETIFYYKKLEIF